MKPDHFDKEEPIVECDKCGQETYPRLVGDEIYNVCDECKKVTHPS